MKKPVKFEILGGGGGIIADVGGEDLWALRIGGALINLGRRAEWYAKVDPFPHAWRITFKPRKDDNRTIWFDVSEADAVQIEAYIGENPSEDWAWD